MGFPVEEKEMGVLVDMGVSPQAWVMPLPCSLLIWGSPEENRGAEALPGENTEVKTDGGDGDREARAQESFPGVPAQSRAHILQNDL